MAERPVALPPDRGKGAPLWPTSEPIAQADRHIAGAKANIAKQERLIVWLAANGHHVRDAESLLSVLIETLKGFEVHRRAILGRLAE